MLKVLVKTPVSAYSGYGNDGIGLCRALMRSGADVYLAPTHVDPPLPPDVLSLLGKRLEAPFDLMVHHIDPMQLGLLPQERDGSHVTVGISMWEYSNFNNMKGRSKLRKALTSYDLILGYDEVTRQCFEPYINKSKTALGILQGGFLPEEWPKVERDWFSPRFSFCMTGMLHAQPLDAKILTATGWKFMKDISIGDVIVDPEGGQQIVEGVSDQSVAKVYTVTLSDGSKTRATGDHLWRVKKKVGSQVRTTEIVRTEDMIKSGLKTTANNWKFTLPSPVVDYIEQDVDLDPYLLGVILGDGCSSDSSMTITCVDESLIQEVEKVLPSGVTLKVKEDGKTWKLLGCDHKRDSNVRNIIKRKLLDLNLCGVKTPDKFVPRHYIENSREIRLAVLQGLLDTDGWVNSTGAGFTSTSPLLVQAVIDIVRSLGGNANVSGPKNKTYTYNDEKRFGRTSWDVSITCDFNPFRMSRKRDRWTPASNVAVAAKKVVLIEETGEDVVQCISVSGPSKTYVTDDYIVTHNTRKDPFVTILAFKELKEEYPEEFEPAELHLKTMSPGLHSAMQEWVPKLRVHYASWPEDVLKQFYASQHVLCAPSRGEGKNMPALEFQSMGGAVIATNWGGHTGWLSSEYSYPLDYKLMPLDDNPSVSNARADKDHMKQLMLHTFRNRAEVKRKADLAAEVIPQIMSWDSVVDRLYAKVGELVPGKGQEVYQKSLMMGEADD